MTIRTNMQNKTYHDQMWTELLKSGSADKSSTSPIQLTEGTLLVNNLCFACDEAYIRYCHANQLPIEHTDGTNAPICVHCPIKGWNPDDPTAGCYSRGSVYDVWANISNTDINPKAATLVRKEFAAKIALLPWSARPAEPKLKTTFYPGDTFKDHNNHIYMLCHAGYDRMYHIIDTETGFQPGLAGEPFVLFERGNIERNSLGERFYPVEIPHSYLTKWNLTALNTPNSRLRHKPEK